MTSFGRLTLSDLALYLLKLLLPVLLQYSIRYSIEYFSSKLLDSGSPTCGLCWPLPAGSRSAGWLLSLLLCVFVERWRVVRYRMQQARCHQQLIAFVSCIQQSTRISRLFRDNGVIRTSPVFSDCLKIISRFTIKVCCCSHFGHNADNFHYFLTGYGKFRT